MAITPSELAVGRSTQYAASSTGHVGQIFISLADFSLSASVLYLNSEQHSKACHRVFFISFFFISMKILKHMWLWLPSSSVIQL
jgi:hypothetical protein